MPDLTHIQDLCAQLERGDLDSTDFLERFTHALAAEIDCSRASVWVFIDTPEGRALRCVAMYDAQRDRMVASSDMVGPDVTAYFETLLRDGCVVAPDVRSHPATAGFLPHYLEPLDVRSMMDVCFSVNGELFGTFCCEQIGEPARWTPRQLQFLRHVGSRASLALMRAVSNPVDTSPGALWETSTPQRLATMPMPLDPSDD